MVYIVALNGPPHCGKDTIGNALADQDWGITSFAFSVARPIRLAGFELLGIPYTDEAYASIKDLPFEVFSGDTFRKWIIRFSETFMKPAYGEAVFGDLARLRIKGLTDSCKIPAVIFVTDVGFCEEQLRLIDLVGKDNYILIHMYRDGCDWSKDSRNYVYLDVEKHRVDNNSTVSAAVQTIRSIMIRKGWSL